MTTAEALRKSSGILFTGPMVKALLEGRKTQTRRVVQWKRDPNYTGDLLWSGMSVGHPCTGRPDTGWCLYSRGAGACWNQRTEAAFCPYGTTGDRLWVRETFCLFGNPKVVYRANCVDANDREDGDAKRCRMDYGCKWKPSIFMPRWASRITLEIVSLRVERVQQISPFDALREGINPKDHGQHSSKCDGLMPEVCCFRNLWNSINGKRGFPWSLNPWVWVIEFKRV